MTVSFRAEGARGSSSQQQHNEAGPPLRYGNAFRVLEREADAERRSLTSAESSASTPITLPTPKETLRIAFDLERRLIADVTKGREELRHLFRDGRIDLMPPTGAALRRAVRDPPMVLLTRDSLRENAGFVRYTGE
jgi:hypothetical protein